jgi:hypothetical protein
MLQAFVFEFALRGLPSRQRLCNPSSHFPLIYSGQQCNQVGDDGVGRLGMTWLGGWE